MNTEMQQLTLPIECPECECGTVLNCACDWEMDTHVPYENVKEFRAPKEIPTKIERTYFYKSDSLVERANIKVK